MKNTLTVFVFFLLIQGSPAQQYFQKFYEGIVADVPNANAIKTTTDSGYIVAGFWDNLGVPDAYLLKVAENGDIEWAKTYGDSGLTIGGTRVYDVLQTADSGYLAVGYANGFGAGSYDVCLLKTDAGGNLEWARTYGGSGTDWGKSIHPTDDGGYIIAGYTQSYGAGEMDVYLIKIDANANLQWTRTYGGSSRDVGYEAKQCPDGGYIIAGVTQSFGEGMNDIYLIRTDSLGNIIWTKTYGGAGDEVSIGIGSAYFGKFSLEQTSDSGYVIAASTSSFGAGDYDVYVIKTDKNGDTLWTKTYGGSDLDFGVSIKQTADTGYMIVGWTRSFGGGNWDIYLIRTNPVGDTLWTKTYGDNYIESAISFEKIGTEGYIIAGFAQGIKIGTYLIGIDTNGNSECNKGQHPTTTIVGNTSTIVGSGAIIDSGGVAGNAALTVIDVTSSLIDVCDTTTYVNEEITEANGIMVYPNPAHSELYIEGNFDVPATFELYDITGRKVLSQSINSNQPININQLSKGLYLYLLNADNKAIARGKVVIE